MRIALAALLLCAASAAFCKTDLDREKEAIAAIDACVPLLDAALDVGYDRIAARCPRLARSIEQTDWAEWLPRGWNEARNDLSAGSLIELRTLIAREVALPASGAPHPRVAQLKRVLADLGPSAQERSSLWTRFRGWLRSVVERNREEEERSWLDKMIQRNGRSQTVMELLTYGSMALITILAGIIVFNELRAAGLIRRRIRAGGDDAALRALLHKRLAWSDVERAPAADKPRVLLELVIARLTDVRRLPPAGALTVRELTRSASLDDSADRQRLLAVASVAERARYSDEALMPEAVGEAVEAGRELLESLARPA